jgi:hypothetical protein
VMQYCKCPSGKNHQQQQEVILTLAFWAAKQQKGLFPLVTGILGKNSHLLTF